MAETKVKCPRCACEATLGPPPNFDPLDESAYRVRCPAITESLDDRGAHGGSATDIDCPHLGPALRAKVAMLRAEHRGSLLDPERRTSAQDLSTFERYLDHLGVNAADLGTDELRGLRGVFDRLKAAGV